MISDNMALSKSVRASEADKIAPLLMSVFEAAALLDCHPQHVRNLIREGQIGHVRVGRKMMIPRTEFAAYLSPQREVSGTSVEPEESGPVMSPPREVSGTSVEPEVPMTSVTLTELRQKAGQLATRAARGETFGVILNGLVVAVLGPAREEK